MSFTFRPAVRENVPLLIGLAGASGSGKTLSALKLAQGIVGRGQTFAVIDTEARRALHYAPVAGAEPDFIKTFRFAHVELKAPFRPEVYLEAIRAADEAHYGAVVIDSFSHEHEGEGGVLDWQERELDEMIRRALVKRPDEPDWKLRDAYKRSSWIAPKRAHKQMVQRFLQMRAHLIFCLRAEDKIDFVKDKDGKTQVVPMQTLAGFKGWIPICDKRFPFELTASFVLLPDKPGVPQPIKLQEQHKAFFPLDQPITEKAGEQLAAWARGGAEVHPASAAPVGAGAPARSAAPPTDLRKRLLADLARLGKKLKLSDKERVDYKITYCGGQDVDFQTVDPAALTDLVNALRVRAGEPNFGDSPVTPAARSSA